LFYVGGELKKTVAGVTPSAPAGALWVGVSGTGGTELYSGLLDELRVWGKARSADELRAAARVSLRGDEPGLLHYYRFDETQGAAAVDAAGALPLASPGGAQARWRRSDAPLVEAAR
jgi:hypothetical protein